MIINWIFIGSIRKEWLMLMRLSPSFVCLVCVCVPSQRALFGRPGAAPVLDWCEKRLFKAIFTYKRSIYQARLGTNIYGNVEKEEVYALFAGPQCALLQRLLTQFELHDLECVAPPSPFFCLLLLLLPPSSFLLLSTKPQRNKTKEIYQARLGTNTCRE